MQAEMQLKFNEVNYTLEILKKHIDWDSSIIRLNELELLIENPKFWNDAAKAQLIMKDKKNLEKIIEMIKGIEIEKLNLVELLNLAEQECDKDLIEDTMLQINDLDNLDIIFDWIYIKGRSARITPRYYATSRLHVSYVAFVDSFCVHRVRAFIGIRSFTCTRFRFRDS